MYAGFVNNMNYTHLKKSVLNSSISDTVLVKELLKLQKIYTQDRGLLNKITWNDDNISAYTLFYMLTNMPKLSFLYDKLPKELLKEIEKNDFIDFGCGPGTYSWEHLKYLKNSKKIIQIEHNELMYKQCDRIAKDLFSNYLIERKFKLEKNKSSTLLFGNSANELTNENILLKIKIVDPKTLLFIEPGTKEVFHKLNMLREDLFKLGYKFIYPCSASSSCCPIKTDDIETDDWCHQVIKIVHQDEVERLGQMAKMDRRKMPCLLWALTKNEVKLQDLSLPKEAYLQRNLSESKFAFNWICCVDIENKNKLLKFEILKKSLTKSEIKNYKNISTGITFNYELVKVINENCYRVKLI